MYLIISPNSTTIFGWWKNRKNWRFLCWAHWSSHLTKAIAALNPEQSFTVTTIYLSRNPSLMVKSLLLMVKLPRIHYEPPKILYTHQKLPNHSPMKIFHVNFPGRSGLPLGQSAVDRPSTSASKPFSLQDSQAFGPGPFASAGVG